MPSSLSLLISSFWFKVRDAWLFLPPECLEATAGLLNGIIQILLCLGGKKGWRETGRDGGQPVGGAVRARTTFMHNVCCLIWAQFTVPQHSYYSNIKDHWSQTNMTNTMTNKMSEILQELSRSDTETKWVNGVGKMVLIYLMWGLPQTFNL